MGTKPTDELTIGQAAQYLGVAVDTLRRLERDGHISADRTPGGHRRFRRHALDHFRRNRPNALTQANAAPRWPTARLQAVARNPRPVLDPEDEEECIGPAVVDDWDDSEDYPGSWMQAPQPAPPPVLPLPSPRTEAPTMPSPQKAQDTRKRLDQIKARGITTMAYDVPAEWRAKVVEALEQYVTPERFPPWLADWEAWRIVQGHIEDLLTPWHEETRRAADQERVAVEKERRGRALLDHGMAHASRLTSSGDWDYAAATEARREVTERLKTELRASWTELDVRDRVEEILAEWEDEDDAPDGFDDA